MAFRTGRTWFLGICLVLFSSSLFAANGRIMGRITRANGSGIGGVIVQVIELSKVELSDPNGDFRFDVPPGTYTVQFVAGEQAASQNNVTVESGGTTRLDKQVDWNLKIGRASCRERV